MTIKKKIALAKKVWFMNIADNGKKRVSPCIAVEGEPGYYATDIEWNISKNFTWEDAKAICAEKNRKLGHTKEDCERIIHETIRLQVKIESW